MVVCNQNYNEDYITLGDLPAVADDYKNAKHTVRMMGILPENTFEVRDASFDELDETIEWLSYRIAALTRVLESRTGIVGIGFMQQGLYWTTLRPHAMKLVAPFDYVMIDLDKEDQ